MPGKHVHFSTSSFPSSSTPSPTFSSSTLPSSTGPVTPPPLGFGSPYHNTPLPGIAAVAHRLLSVTASPAVEYDLSYSPSTIKPLMYPMPADIWDQPATMPTVPFMDISCPRLPWRVTVVPRSKTIGYVTIGDVFEALYRALRINVTAAEFALIPSPDAKKKVTTTYQLRYKRQSDVRAYEDEKAHGLKRVDFLGEHTHFKGLTSSKGGVGGWILHVS